MRAERLALVVVAALGGCATMQDVNKPEMGKVCTYTADGGSTKDIVKFKPNGDIRVDMEWVDTRTYGEMLPIRTKHALLTARDNKLSIWEDGFRIGVEFDNSGDMREDFERRAAKGNCVYQFVPDSASLRPRGIEFRGIYPKKQ